MEDKKYWDSVKVPDGGAIPMGQESMMSMMPQFNTDLFQCPDGTLISKSTGKVLRDNTKNTDFPGSKLRMIKQPSSSDWNDSDIMNFNPCPSNEEQAGLSKDDIAYAELSKKENEKLKQNMTDLQKKLLSDLESGKMLRLTKLVDENQ